MEEKNSDVKSACCKPSKTPFLAGLLGFLIVGWVFLAAIDKVGLGISTLLSKRTITVTGSANRQETNQLASFNATVSSKNADKAVAVSEVTQKSQKLVDDLKTFGVADKDLKTQSLNIYREQTPYWDNGVQKYKDGDWTASISTDITLRDLAKSGELTDLLAKSDTSNIYGPNYALTENEPDKTVLLKTAFDNAKAKAESLAKGMGLKVGKVVNVVEGSQASAIYPLRDVGMGGGAGGMEPGSSSVSTSLTVTFELR